MKCKMCGGAGVIQGQAPGLVSCCPACDGKGFIKQTNDEWRKTCSTEDFAEAMTKVVLDLVAWNNDPKPSEVRNILKTWLKQPHQSVTNCNE